MTTMSLDLVVRHICTSMHVFCRYSPPATISPYLCQWARDLLLFHLDQPSANRWLASGQPLERFFRDLLDLRPIADTTGRTVTSWLFLHHIATEWNAWLREYLPGSGSIEFTEEQLREVFQTEFLGHSQDFLVYPVSYDCGFQRHDEDEQARADELYREQLDRDWPASLRNDLGVIDLTCDEEMEAGEEEASSAAGTEPGMSPLRLDAEDYFDLRPMSTTDKFESPEGWCRGILDFLEP